MAITKIKTAGIGILIALLVGTTGVMAVNEIQKRQTPIASEKPDIAASPSKQEVHDQPKSSENDEQASAKLETKDKGQSAKVKQPPKARNFQAEIEKELARLPRGEIRYSDIEAIMREWFDFDKDGAIEWTLRLTGPGRTSLFTIAAYVWTEKDPVAASEWAMKLPEVQNREFAFFGVGSAWTKKDPIAASEWAIKLPEGSNRDQVLGSMFVVWAKKDPIAASECAMKLPGQARNDALRNVARNWAKSELDKAKKWIEKSSLSQEEKDKLLKIIPKK